MFANYQDGVVPWDFNQDRTKGGRCNGEVEKTRHWTKLKSFSTVLFESCVGGFAGAMAVATNFLWFLFGSLVYRFRSGSRGVPGQFGEDFLISEEILGGWLASC